MAERTIQTTQEITKSVSVTICDRCGMEAENPERLKSGVQRGYSDEAKHVLDNPEKFKSPKYAPMLTKGTFMSEVMSYVTLEYDQSVTVCSDCFELIFGWSE